MSSKDIIGQKSAARKFTDNIKMTWSRLLDQTVPHRPLRWVMFVFMLSLYILRVYFCGGFYVISYVLGIHLLFLLVQVITPLADEDLGSEGQLPHTAASPDEEFRPFVPRMQEFVVWCSMMKSVLVCTFLTLFRILDIPVFWPVLLLYFIFLTIIQVGERIRHMIRHRYVPWSAGKPKFVPKS
ncbi:endoplasmatic reticulum retrieval protein, putative [Trypanosoma equiperdum]|uniref:Protein RER1 n=4 Tax=Trypanozoon TaxID=39700 RepID=Q57XM3_TRYB2|nr:endoplasmatic reticulum retrieval protein,putative [Trypanosoma brucei gambiense DAL972]XP_845874.1 endoplasmatic reticulum retrieval protein, putative [Trypanosoma brucei brucei TREU927]AAX69646.1 endoplasmatic reticulum retrieval protein, putative [Trypanosoma brucei]RHW71453.1 endoplasmatic reticulum retrieval protein [Trypanosoma brucei equiperdum]SCU68875.1 endoplasmatic reticulum retrieval protein, putative [Trypanosoma equiperdum]AAZ12315.1 endoplasmatic reticulum retrieval protein, |eukprot:XP_011774604.1 endoplasmatic reticulum retrieval protein,putative [Trypanosoma brucei gambiense DAL972]